MANVYLYIPEFGPLKTTLYANQVENMRSAITGGLEWKMVKLAPKKKGPGFYLNEMHGVEQFCRSRGIMV